MGGKTLTRVDLAEAVYRKVGLSRTESADLVESVLSAIAERMGVREKDFGAAYDSARRAVAQP